MPADYSGQNLRGRSFRCQNLEGANFSGADIRSADFSGANLTRADFSHVKAGLQRRWATFLVVVSLVLMGLSGFLSAIAGYWVASLLFSTQKNDQLAYQIAGWTIIAILVIFLFVTIRQGIQGGLGAFAGAFAVAVAGSGAGVLVLVLAFAGGGAGARAVVVAVGAAAVAGAFAFAFAVSGAGALAVAGAEAGAAARALAVPGAVVVAFSGALALAGAVGAFAFALTVAVTGALVLVSRYISWRALKGDPKHALIRNIAIAFAAISGTSFRNADLTDANFTQATLKSTDLRKANLTRTCFYKTKKLDRVRPGTTYLQKVEVCDVVVKGRVQNNNFDRQDLRGVNFKGASLIDASFIGADLSEANLQDVDLSRAKLVQTQLDGTDLTGAILTGVYIQDWGITRDTKFDGVRCEYVYMRVPTLEDPDPVRKPDNKKEVFADGEFGDFIQPIFDTLDLYHNQGVDPRAIAVAFKELAENNPNAELEIVAIERRGDDKILLRAKTAATGNKSELSKEYFINYNQLKELAEKDFQELIAAKQSQIIRLENMVLTALERPNFYAETVQHQGDIVSQKTETSHYDLQKSKFGGGFAGTGGNQTGGTFHEDSSNQNLELQPQILLSNHIVCTQCDRPNPNTFKFCIKCGAKLTSPT